MSAPRSSRWSSRITGAALRQLTLFLFGLGGMVWEAGFVEEPRVILVMAYLGFLGVPAFNGFDRLLRRPANPGEATAPSNSSSDVTALLTPPADASSSPSDPGTPS